MPTNPLVAIVTMAYPYGAGEQFVASELDAWARADAQVVVLPITASGDPRPVPAGIEVDLTMARRYGSRPGVAADLAAATVDPALRTELADLRRRGMLSGATAFTGLKAVAQVRALDGALRRVAAARGAIDIVYTYWLKPFTVGALRARDAGHVAAVVSRAHGTDLYEEARPQQYNPLVRAFTTHLDGLYPISDQGAAYAVERYGFPADVVHTARLGVVLPPEQECAPPSSDGCLRVLSISSMTPLKRLPILAEALALVAERGLDVSWRHLGDGPLRPEVESLVSARLKPLGVDVDLAGHLAHDELLAGLSRATDLMVNASSSEGVPVSVMEAQAHGIPCLATDVGATREVVPAPYLVPSDVTPAALAERIVDVLDDARSPRRRLQVRDIVLERFDATRNHERFVADVLSTAR